MAHKKSTTPIAKSSSVKSDSTFYPDGKRDSAMSEEDRAAMWADPVAHGKYLRESTEINKERKKKKTN